MSIAKASETARPGDRETLDKAGAALRASIASINGVVEHAWAADHQWKQLYWKGGGGLFVGALGTPSILHFFGRNRPRHAFAHGTFSMASIDYLYGVT